MEKTLIFDDIEMVCILVQVNGNCHQVLSTAENKLLTINLLAKMDGSLRLSEEIQPVILTPKP